ncbi:DUF5105 domain-containing protein [Isobaculum melis]|uniref:DUF5105 domain-containing protein n=1 Tax=Isobaculum melis TaxID=142588 RepID=A0A1H9TTZ6_9LACT|nr:DUF5105 domain-containing protein [Isobaculum melis]SES00569.1 protein of unknown function [Isobaculum melis]
MKKGLIAFACVFLLAGCSLGPSKNNKEDAKQNDKTAQSDKKEEKSSRIDPKKAVEALIDGVVYEKNLDQLEAAFDVDPSELEGLIESSFVSGFMESTDNSEATTKQAHDLWATLVAQVKAKATYEVTVIKDDVKKPVVKVTVKGINMNSIEKALQDRVVKEVLANPSLADDDAALTAFVFDIYRQELENVKATDTAKSFELKLSPDPLNKKVWTFDGDDDAFSDMLASFFFSEIDELDLDDDDK